MANAKVHHDVLKVAREVLVPLGIPDATPVLVAAIGQHFSKLENPVTNDKVTVEMIRDNAVAIRAAFTVREAPKPRDPELKNQPDFEDFADFLSGDERNEWDRGEESRFRGKVRIKAALEWFREQGYSASNKAPDGTLDAYIKRQAELHALYKGFERKVADIVEKITCARAAHDKREPAEFPPAERSIVLKDKNNVPTGAKTTERFGEVRVGDVLFDREIAKDLINKIPLVELATADLMKAIESTYRPYCRDCQYQFTRRLYEANEKAGEGERQYATFWSLRMIKEWAERVRDARLGRKEDADFEASAIRKRAPKPDGYGTRKGGRRHGQMR